MNEIKLFPLSSMVLPEGKMSLRIFEPRYKRLVAECSRQNSGFGICLLDSDAGLAPGNVSSIGTYVKIVDFETLDDGLLGITVSGTQRFVVERVAAEFDGLRKAHVRWLDNWSQQKIERSQQYISEQLQFVYRQFPQIGDLYSHCFFDDASWVSQRWLEILPLECTQMEQLAGQRDCSAAMHFLSMAIEGSVTTQSKWSS
ncbi:MULTISPECIES: LON peptidase substrate-binding domain-containing protein [Vibrio]|uniref:Lon N-terminal domain-containing protein n=1 Tax=Vibrio proteolyticus NBRC 13287 TaxID=1219065 RepID=U3A3K5_VIBPR|nr:MULTISPECIES: LON peptidase substrate-binding domain-containing protein [Vibrio]NAX22800.1 ATP-dependent protease [Vibrio sp. V39_P1S14PM300]GAD67917.1 hypothetical protein VPR01S_10_01130 [Vibrio proteolyticus NBRC 13287]